MCDYLDETGLTLIKVSDEIMENCHHLFHKCLTKGFVVKDISHSAHGDKLYNGVRAFNAYNLQIKRL